MRSLEICSECGGAGYSSAYDIVREDECAACGGMGVVPMRCTHMKLPSGRFKPVRLERRRPAKAQVEEESISDTTQDFLAHTYHRAGEWRNYIASRSLAR